MVKVDCNRKLRGCCVGKTLLKRRDLDLFWRQIKRNRLVVQVSIVRTVAEWFVFRQPATTQAQCRSALESVYVSLWVYNFKIALNFEGSVRIYCDFCAWHKIDFRSRKGSAFTSGPGNACCLGPLNQDQVRVNPKFLCLSLPN
jgi:hypothetical protein